MSVEALKRLAQASLELWRSDSSVDPDDVFSKDYVNHQEPDAAGGISRKDLAEWKDMVDGFQEAFSDFKSTVLMQVAEGDQVATHWQFEAVNTGTYLGQEATGRKAVWTGMQIDRVRDGRIVESWVCWDKSRMLETLSMSNE